MKSQINALTSTRAVAAIMVVIHHFGSDLFPFSLSKNIFHGGNIAVSYFFVLSGFVLFISYNRVVISYADYFKRRIGRIVPVYLLALALMICFFTLYKNYTLDGKASKEIFLSMFFLQAYVPSYPLVLNSPAWTISVEMFFYILFPFFLLLLNKNAKAFAAITLVLFIASQAFHLEYYSVRWSLPDSIVDTVFFNPAMHINQFMIGMIGGYLFSKNKLPAERYKWSALILFCCIILLIAFRPENISYQVGLIAPVFMLFILCVAICNPKILNVKGFIFLGEISYGIYILQFPVYKFLEVFNERLVHMPKQFFFYFALFILLLAASLSYRFIEQPLRRKISSLKLNRAS